MRGVDETTFTHVGLGERDMIHVLHCVDSSGFAIVLDGLHTPPQARSWNSSVLQGNDLRVTY